ncbi:hypothetical protein B0H17DRAFT_1336403 [Mycena rosella]|uniref:Uncharacterized protein n=1 Tax=Mycena rosella TaxID=1033263 RepID=A0AAD7CW18_MYCRO|nr:hypothetical protein B0H17DRAFT_1336403 [Mycena rosella]
MTTTSPPLASPQTFQAMTRPTRALLLRSGTVMPPLPPPAPRSRRTTPHGRTRSCVTPPRTTRGASSPPRCSRSRTKSRATSFGTKTAVISMARSMRSSTRPWTPYTRCTRASTSPSNACWSAPTPRPPPSCTPSRPSCTCCAPSRTLPPPPTWMLLQEGEESAPSAPASSATALPGDVPLQKYAVRSHDLVGCLAPRSPCASCASSPSHAPELWRFHPLATRTRPRSVSTAPAATGTGTSSSLLRPRPRRSPPPCARPPPSAPSAGSARAPALPLPSTSRLSASAGPAHHRASASARARGGCGEREPHADDASARTGTPVSDARTPASSVLGAGERRGAPSDFPSACYSPHHDRIFIGGMRGKR